MIDLEAMSDDELYQYVVQEVNLLEAWTRSELGQLVGCTPQCEGCRKFVSCPSRRVLMRAVLVQVTRSIHKAWPTGTGVS